jgi:hypothetical protein
MDQHAHIHAYQDTHQHSDTYKDLHWHGDSDAAPNTHAYPSLPCLPAHYRQEVLPTYANTNLNINTNSASHQESQL